MHTIKTTLLLTAIAVSLAGCKSTGDTSASNDSGMDTAQIATIASSLAQDVQPYESSPLVGTLMNQLSVSPQQATGGAGALLALASNSLSPSDSSELSSLIPGMSSLQNSAPSLMDMASNLGAVNNIFGGLGLDPTMVSQFAPVILKYITGQGASAGLLSSLSSLWGV